MSYNPNNPNGQATMANSAPVVIASDQSAVPVTGTFYQATQPVSIASSVAVTGTFWQAVQPVSGTVTANISGSISNTSFDVTQATAANLNATVVGTGTFAVQAAQSGTWSTRTQDGSGNAITSTSNALDVNVKNTSIAVTGTFYQATQPVSGTVTANAGTGTMNVAIVASASGGDTVYHLVSAASTNATNIKASAGKVTGWYIYNSNASARKVAFHNTAGTPTAGSSVYYSIVIPGLAATNVSFPDGIDFSTGIAITTVTDLTDAGATAVGLNDLIINIYYK